MVALALKDVGAAYGRTTVLSKVGIDTLESGSVTAVIGPNAAGKSTLFKRIASLISGPGLVELSDTARGKRAICYMPQDTGANAVLTVYESCCFPPSRAAAGVCMTMNCSRSTPFSRR